MRKKIFILLMVVCLLSCNYQKEEHLAKTNSPLQTRESEIVFENYWKYSNDTKFEEAKKLVTSPPDAFFHCYSETVSQCNEKLKNIKARESKDNSEYTLKPNIETDFIIKDRIPSGIQSGHWKTYKILDSQENATQARVRVFIEGKGFSFRKDFLLHKIDNKWKIFAVVEEGLHEAYASPLLHASDF